MKLKILQEELSKALNITSRFVNPRAQLPVLSNILLQTEKNKLQICATNLEVSLSVSVGAKIEKQGKITVPARTITDLVSNLGHETIELSVVKENIKVTSTNFNSQVLGMNASDFPDIPNKLSRKANVLPKKRLIDSLSQILFAVSSDETRPVLTGVLVIFKGKTLYLVSTDGFRLSQKKMTISKVKGLTDKSFILPKNALSELSRLASESEEVKIDFNDEDNQVIFGADNYCLTSRIIEGEFPDFEKIIPKQSEYVVLVDREELLRSVKLASVFARDSANVIKLKLTKDSIQISAESSKAGSQENEIDAKVEKTNGKSSFEIAFNYRFLEDLLNTLKGEEIKLEFVDANAPGLFTDPKDRNFFHLIMPVKLQS